MSFVPRIIVGGGSKSDHRRFATSEDLSDISRLNRALFRIRSPELRLKVIAFIEDVAEAEWSERQ